MIKSILRGKQHLLNPQLYAFSELKKFSNNFLSTTNLAFIQGLYQQWKQDKSSVSPSFNAYFEELQKGGDPETSFTKPPEPGTTLELQQSRSPYISQQLKLKMMIQRFRSIGHQFAKVDPLGIPRNNFIGSIDKKKISLDQFQFTEEQKNLEYSLKKSRSPDADVQKYKVKDMHDYLESVYCGVVGYEYIHVLSKEERDFLKLQIEENLESLKTQEPTKDERLKAFERLCKDQCFIDFLTTKFATLKRFGIEGLNAATVAMEELVESAANQGVENLILGMAHRGRLNTLHCVFDKPSQQIFKEFLEKFNKDEDLDESSGDVKYHLGKLTRKKFGNNQITLSMMPNPSHLETVNPLIYGSVRAVMEATKDPKGDKTLGVLVHGDAAMAGQGIVYECAEMQDLNDYTPKGIIHIVMNNQIGFTTNPSQARSSYYCTEVAKVIGAPVFHVNANEPATLSRAIKIAVAYRSKFKKDIFIDIVGYRRYGHNEQDQPFFTQPKMYEIIKNTPTVYQTFAKRMIEKGVLTAEQIKQKRDKYMKEYEAQYQKVLNQKFDVFKQTEDKIYKVVPVKTNTTGVAKSTLEEVFSKLTTWPSDFNIHPTIKKIYDERIKNFKNNETLDWATMESLAYATLLKEGYGVRLSGQDVQRGTFSHRHAFISDQLRDVPKHFFLKNISNKACVSNSHLSQYGVLGFEYGYSITDPNYLTIWEAQFGDFSNGATIIIDNYLVSSESKWDMQSGLVMSLPHGMDGQGPEHSSARIERYLQLSDDNCDVCQNLTYKEQLESSNIQIVTCSTTSNVFHAYRRQLIRNFRKPLIMFNSKKLLKFKGANSPISEILEGTQFKPVIPDESNNPSADVKKVLICNGQFYYQLKAKRDQLNRKDIAIVRIEQIAPFPVEHLKKALSCYGANVKYYWVQEEHENYGAWNFVYPRLKLLLNQKVGFHGRSSSASTANGRMKIHKLEEESLLKSIFSS